jgi:MT0933-like antitoxin protein
MGLLDIFKRSKGTVEQHGDKIADGVDKATDVADDKTGGKYTEHLDKADDMADKLRDKDTPQ